MQWKMKIEKISPLNSVDFLLNEFWTSLITFSNVSELHKYDKKSMQKLVKSLLWFSDIKFNFNCDIEKVTSKIATSLPAAHLVAYSFSSLLKSRSKEKLEVWGQKARWFDRK